MDSRVSVLHVDDDPSFTSLAAASLQESDDAFQVKTATDAAAARDVLDGEIDCIVSDYEMPDMDGIGFLKQVRQTHPELPFILYTGRGSEDVASEAIAAGVDGYVQKDPGSEQFALLANRIRNLVRQREAEQDLETRVRQQERVATLGREALAIDELQELFDRAVTVCRDVLGVQCAAILSDAETGLDVEASVGWSSATAENAGYAIRSDNPSTVEDRREDPDRTFPEYLADQGVPGGSCVLIGNTEQPWGLLWVQDGTSDADSGEDLNFLQNVANILSATIEQHERECELAETKEWYESLLTYSSDFVLVLDESRSVEYVSPAITRVLGGDICESPCVSVLEHVHPDDRPRAKHALERVSRAPGSTMSAEFRLERADGGWQWVEVRGRNLEEESAVQGLLLNIRDIAERKEREAEVQARTRQLQGILDTIDASVWVRDMEGRYVWMNETYREELDVGEVQVVGRTPVEVLGEDLGEQFMAADQQVIETEEPLVNVRRRETSEGERVALERLVPVYDQDGEITEICGVATDITEQQRTERRLQRFRKAVEASGHAIHFADIDGTIEYVNPTYEALHGVDADDTCGTTSPLLTPEGDGETARAIRERVQSGEIWRGEVTAETDAGEEIVLDQTVAPVRDETGELSHFVVIAADITERTERERKHREQVNRLELALEAGEIAIWDWNVKTDRISFDRRFADMLGHELEEIEQSADLWLDKRHPDDHDRVLSALNAHLRGETEYFNVEQRIRTKDGNWTWIRDVGQVIERDAEGDPVRAIGCAIDITDQKHREQALRERTQELEAVLETIDASVWMRDANYEYRLVNESYREHFGLTTDDVLVGKTPHAFADQELADRFVELDQHVLETGEPIEMEEVIPSGDREIITLTRISPVRDDDGDIIATCGVGTDITEHKRNEQRLNAMVERFERVLKETETAVWEFDFETQQGEWFGPVEELTNTEWGEMDGVSEISARVAHPEEQPTVEDAITELVEGTRDRVDVEHRAHPADHNEPWLRTQAFLESTADGTQSRLTGLTTNITELKQRELRLEKFAGMVSHDLRNPLNVASGRIGLAADDCDSEHLAMAGEAIERMDELIDHLLTWATEGQSPEELSPVGLEPLVTDSWRTVPTAEATLAVTTDQVIRGEQRRLKHLFENLIGNAIEHGEDDVSITVGPLPDGFYIEDDGEGIPPDERGAVLEPGYSTNADGIGFGLSIVQEICDAHDWDLTITESTEGGARFEITDVDMVA